MSYLVSNDSVVSSGTEGAVGGGGGGSLWIASTYTTLEALETGSPAASNNGLYAVVNGTTSANGGYQSDGASWVKIFDEIGDPTDLPSWAGGISYLAINEMDRAGTLSGRNTTDTADSSPNQGSLGNVNDESNTSYCRFSGQALWYNMFTTAPNALGQFVIVPYSNVVASMVRSFEIFGRSSSGTITYIPVDSATDSDTGATVTISNGEGTNTVVTSDSTTLGHQVTVNTLNTTAYDGYGIKLISRQDLTSTSIGIGEMYGYESVDSTAFITASSEIKQLHEGYSKSTGGTAITADTLLDDTSYIVELDSSGGAFTMTLPAVSTVKNGKRYLFKMVGAGSNAVTLDGSGAETIDGATTNATALATQYDSVEIYNNGTEWLII